MPLTPEGLAAAAVLAVGLVVVVAAGMRRYLIRRRYLAEDPVRRQLDRLYRTDPAAARLLSRQHERAVTEAAAARRQRVPINPEEARRYYEEHLSAARRCDLTVRYLARQARRGKAAPAEVTEARESARRFRAEAAWAKRFLPP